MPKGVYQRKKGGTPWNKGLTMNSDIRIIAPWLGKKRPSPSAETKEKMRLSMIGKNLGKTYEHSMEVRRAKSERQRGEKSHLWKGGLTKKHQSIRTSLEYRLWRESVYQRDNYTCVWCGARSARGVKVYLEADHIKPFSQYPELRFAIDNGRTLCKPCHKTTDTYANKARKYAEEV